MIDGQKVADWAAKLLINNPYPGKSQRELVEIIQACEVQSFADGQVILEEGSQGEELYFLMEGEVVVLKKDTNGEQRELVVMTAPTMFGHMSLVDGSPRSATCRAKNEVVVAALSRRTYQEFLSRPHPIGTNLRRLMLATLTRQLVDGNERLFNLIGGDLPQPASQRPAPSRPAPAASGQQASPKKRRTRRDVSRDDLLDMAGILNGWKVDTSGLEEIEFVETEDDRRRGGKRSE